MPWHKTFGSTDYIEIRLTDDRLAALNIAKCNDALLLIALLAGAPTAKSARHRSYADGRLRPYVLVHGRREAPSTTISATAPSSSSAYGMAEYSSSPGFGVAF